MPRYLTALYISGRKIFFLNKTFNSLRLKVLNNLPGVIILLFAFSLKVNISSFFF